MKNTTKAPAGSLPRMVRRWRMRLAAFIAGGEVLQYEGRRKSGEWLRGDIIATPEATAALKAAFWAGAQVYSDTALTSSPNDRTERRDGPPLATDNNQNVNGPSRSLQ